MERTEELVSLFEMHGYSSWHDRLQLMRPLEAPELHRLEKSAAAHIRSNEQLLHRMAKLVQRKEFSNDPTAQLNELSGTFQRRLEAVKQELDAFTGRLAMKKYGNGGHNSHTEQHWNHIIAGLQKQVSSDITVFQNSLRQHGQQVQQRENRVTKFGQGSEQVRRGHSSFSASTQPSSNDEGGNVAKTVSGAPNYALFSPPPSSDSFPGSSSSIPRPSGKNQGVIRRRNAAGIGTSAAPSVGASNTSGSEVKDEINNSKSEIDKGRKKYFSVAFPTYNSESSEMLPDRQIQQQQQQQRRNGMYRNEQSKQVEESIGKMGKLFSQMSSLVLAQGETIQRIEDDVEAGLEDTSEAHADLVYVHEITKGNRGLIFKIFGLLIFFIMLFMVWT